MTDDANCPTQVLLTSPPPTDRFLAAAAGQASMGDGSITAEGGAPQQR